jgi:hypothetical protein
VSFRFLGGWAEEPRHALASRYVETLARLGVEADLADILFAIQAASLLRRLSKAAEVGDLAAIGHIWTASPGDALEGGRDPFCLARLIEHPAKPTDR